jgi:hypothetical protein
VSKGAFEEFAESLMGDGFDAVAARLEGKAFVSKFKPGTFDKKWYKYLCLEAHDYVWRAQDIHNGKHYSFEAGKEYDMAEAPENLMYIVERPDKFKFITEWIEKDLGRDFDEHGDPQRTKDE